LGDFAVGVIFTPPVQAGAFCSCSDVIFFGAFFFCGRLPAMAFFFNSTCAIDFIVFLLVFSKYLLMILGNFRGRIFRAIFPAVRSSAGRGFFFGTNFSVIFWVYFKPFTTDFITFLIFMPNFGRFCRRR
jgi:hypothetical protein